MKSNFKLNLNDKSQFAVFGLGKFGSSIVRELSRNNKQVFCCDIDEKKVHEMSFEIEHVAEADATDDEFLQRIGIEHFDIVIVSFSTNFESAILTVMKLKELGVPFIVAKANDERHKIVLEKVGADFVVLPEVIMGERLAHALVFNDPLTHIHESDKFMIEQISPKPAWHNKALKDLKLTTKENINVIGIIREDNLLDSINSDTIILSDDILVVIKSLA